MCSSSTMESSSPQSANTCLLIRTLSQDTDFKTAADRRFYSILDTELLSRDGQCIQPFQQNGITSFCPFTACTALLLLNRLLLWVPFSRLCVMPIPGKGTFSFLHVVLKKTLREIKQTTFSSQVWLYTLYKCYSTWNYPSHVIINVVAVENMHWDDGHFIRYTCAAVYWGKYLISHSHGDSLIHLGNL